MGFKLRLSPILLPMTISYDKCVYLETCFVPDADTKPYFYTNALKRIDTYIAEINKDDPTRKVRKLPIQDNLTEYIIYDMDREELDMMCMALCP